MVAYPVKSNIQAPLGSMTLSLGQRRVTMVRAPHTAVLSKPFVPCDAGRIVALLDAKGRLRLKRTNDPCHEYVATPLLHLLAFLLYAQRVLASIS